jgi:hypothetical protein
VIAVDAADRQLAAGLFVLGERQADLPQIVLAMGASRRLARRLHGRQQ